MPRALTKRTRQRARDTFLAELAQRGIVQDACEAAGLSRVWFYSERKADPDFAAAWDQALEEATDRAEREAWRRGVEGVPEPVIGRVDKDEDGQLTDEHGKPMVILKYSDQILLRLLSGRRPERWRERTNGINLNLTPEELSKLSDDDLDRLKQQLG
jgi:hypothetical protein